MNSPALDVVIGVVLIYAVLSLFVTVLVEFFSGTTMNMRGWTLEMAIKSAFGARSRFDGSVGEKVQAFYDNPIIAALFMSGRRPSEISPDAFTQAFLAVVAKGKYPNYPDGRPATPAEFVDTLKTLPTANGDKALAAVAALLPGVEQDWSALESKVGKWFHDIGDRSEGWFKRRMNWGTLGISAAFVVALNVDTLFVVRMLWLDSNLRKSAVARATELTQEARPGGANAAPVAVDPPRHAMREELESGLSTAIARINDALAKSANLRDANVSTPRRDASLFTPKLESCTTKIKACETGAADMKLEGSDQTECVRKLYACEENGDAREVEGCRQERLDCTEGAGKLMLLNAKLVQIRGSLWTAGKRTGIGGDSVADEVATANALFDAEEKLGEVKYALMSPYLLARDTGQHLKKAREALDQAIARTSRLLDERYPSRTRFQVDRICKQYAEAAAPIGSTKYVADYAGCQRLHAEASTGQLGIPMGWDESLRELQRMPDREGLNGYIFAGWVLSTLALMLGAPFWFDLLGRLVKLRSSGAKAAEKTADTDTSAPAGTNRPALSGPPGTAPGGGAAYFPDGLNPLERNLKDYEISRIQQALHITKPSGRFDRETRTAILKWRSLHSLPEGYELTEQMIRELLGYSPPQIASPVSEPAAQDVLGKADFPVWLEQGSAGDAVAQVKSALLRKLDNYIPTPGTQFDEATAAAVERFQEMANLGRDGKVGPETWLKLTSDPDELPAELLKPEWMARAIAEIGQRAIAGAQNNPRVLDYLKTLVDRPSSGDDTPWCAAFLAWVLACTGYRLAKDEQAAEKSRLLLASAWRGWGTASEARYGAIVILKRRGDPDPGDDKPGAHAGFLVRESGNDFVVLGGNQESGSVGVTRFPRASYELLEYRWPDPTMLVADELTEETALEVKPGPQEKRSLLDDPLYPRLARGVRDTSAVTRLQQSLRRAGLTLDVDGLFGPQTESAVRAFQHRNSLPITGEVDAATWTALDPGASTWAMPTISNQPPLRISMADIKDAASKLSVEFAALAAVTSVESAGSGFVGGLPKILFEGHVFWRELKKRAIDPTTAPSGFGDVLYPKWTKAFYRGGSAEHDRLAKAKECAKALNLSEGDAAEVANAAASWGLFQILGANFADCGYNSATAFAAAMHTGEKAQLDAVCEFIKRNPIMKNALMNRDWAAFARAYNGPAYAKNRYDQKLAAAYARATSIV